MYAGGGGIILVNIMDLEKIYNTMMKTVDSARQNAGVNGLAKQLQSKDEYMAMDARAKLSKICQDVAKNTLNNLSVEDRNAFVDYLVNLKYENLKQTEKVFRNDSCGDCYIISWLELNTCNACVTLKNKQSVKTIQKDIRKRRFEKIKSIFSGKNKKNKADEFTEDR